MSKTLNVIFMGTPAFAVPALTAISEAGIRLCLVVTQPDRPKGRGRKLSPPPVKTAAMHMGVEIVQPDSVKSDGFYERVAEHRPDFLVVVAYGHILPRRILEVPVCGAVNLHASLLPKYRGPAPIQWAIINGESETGVTTMLMDTGLDTGDILLSSKTPIEREDTAGTLHDRLARMGGSLLKQTLEGMKAGTLEPVPQNQAEASYAPLLKKSDGRIDWTAPAEAIARRIRGMNPWPLAHTYFGDKRLNIYKAELRPADSDAPPGTVIPGFSGELRVATGYGALSILEIQGASGKRLPIQDFLSGTVIPEGSRLQ